MTAQCEMRRAGGSGKLYTEKLLLRLPSDMGARVRSMATAAGQPAAEFIRESIRMHLNRRSQIESVARQSCDGIIR